MLIVEAIILGAIAWFGLMVVTTNLLGFSVRGGSRRTAPDELQSENVTSHHSPMRMHMVVGGLLAGLFLLLLMRFLSPLFAIAAIMLMISRAPDLLWEIQNGRSITLRDIPRTRVSYATTILSWLAFVVSCYGAHSLLS